MMEPMVGAVSDAPVHALEDLRELAREELEGIIVGYEEPRDLLIVAAVAGGHVLLEGPPGIAKTLMAGSIARALGVKFTRVQFTPDTAPEEVTGKMVRNRLAEEVFSPGAAFTNLLLADEINRTPPRTQAALLEAMQEHHVTVGGRTHWLPTPFMVIATQNPLEMEGTYPLPEAQRDRFMARISVGYPTLSAELGMLDIHSASSPLDRLVPVANATELRALTHAARSVHLSEPVRRYAVNLVAATRTHPGLRLGASPRATLHLARACRAYAALDGRDYVIPDDIQALAMPVLAHRLFPAAQAEQVLADLVNVTPLPG
jgi:MoxR-like ATPase